MRTAFITGGTGFIGRHVLEELHRRGGWRAIVLSRQHHSNTDLVSFVHGDLQDRSLLKETIGRADVVLHLAGCKSDTGAYYSTNVTGTANILAASDEASTKRLIYMSSVGVIGATGDDEVTEETPCRPANEYERSKYQAEQLVTSVAERRPGTVTILRPTNVFGENDPDSHLLNLFTRVRTGRFYFVGKETQQYFVNYLYVREISTLVADLMNRTTDSSLYIVNTPTPLGEFISTVKLLVGDHAPVRCLPYLPVKALACCFDALPRRIVRHPPINSLKLSELTNRRRYLPSLLARETGWRPKFTMEESLGNLVLHYTSQGRLR